MVDQKITVKYVIASLAAVLITWFIHEFTHWITSEALGYESMMRINSVSNISNKEQTAAHDNIISASGPIVTILQAILTYLFLMKKGWFKYLYPLLFTAFYMRFLAGLMNFIKPNDEGRISEFLGLGLFTLSIIVSGLLFYLVYKVSKKYSLNWKLNTATTLMIMIFSSILILTDQFYQIRII